MQHGSYRGVTDEIAVYGDLILLNLLKALYKRDYFAFIIVHIISREVLMNTNILRSFSSQFAQGIIYVMILWVPRMLSHMVSAQLLKNVV